MLVLKNKKKLPSLKARSTLSALEVFAMEREDAATRLAHEKEELLEELKGARSGQDRSAEEVGCFGGWGAGKQCCCVLGLVSGLCVGGGGGGRRGV